jgi:aminopeptidase N
MLQHIKIFISLLIFSAMPLSADDTIHHKMSIDLRPVSHEISATDTITIPASLAKEGIILQVNGDLSVTQISGSVKMTQIAVEKNAADIGIDRDDAGSESLIKVNHYALNGFTEGEDAIISLSLKGSINNPVKQLNEEYARGFSQSPGLIEERGVYLAGSTYWVPTVTDTMITYDIGAQLAKELAQLMKQMSVIVTVGVQQRRQKKSI